MVLINAVVNILNMNYDFCGEVFKEFVDVIGAQTL